MKKLRFDPKRMKRIDIKQGRHSVWAHVLLSDPEGTLIVEEWRPERQADDEYTFYHSEMHYALSGKAELTYSMPPFYDKWETMTVEGGDAYLIPKGLCWKRKVLGEEPYRHLCVIMPGLPGW